MYVHTCVLNATNILNNYEIANIILLFSNFHTACIYRGSRLLDDFKTFMICLLGMPSF